MGRLRVGVYGGTFDPVHYGHLAAASGAAHLAGLDRVVFVPAGQNPLKAGAPITPAVHRLAMVRLAVAGDPRFAVDPIDMERPGPHYTVETLSLLAQAHPDWDIYFIVGMDAALSIEAWRDYRTLLVRWPLLVVTRPGEGGSAWEALLDRLGPHLAGRLRLLEVPGVAVAGRQLRALAAAGYPLTYLVPPAVEEYIRTHRLYGPTDGSPSATG